MDNSAAHARDELRELLKQNQDVRELSYAMQVRADRLRAEIKRLSRVQDMQKRTSIHAHQP